jgi:WD40 repeat protein
MLPLAAVLACACTKTEQGIAGLGGDGSIPNTAGVVIEAKAGVIAVGTKGEKGQANPILKLWDLATHAPTHTLDGHQGQVSALAFFSKGRRLASGDSEGTVRIWDVDTGDLVRSLKCPALPARQRRAKASKAPSGIYKGRASVLALAISPDEQFIAASCRGDDAGGPSTFVLYPDNVQVWELSTGQSQHTLGASDSVKPYRTVSFSGDGKKLAACVWFSSPGGMSLWDLANGQRLETPPVDCWGAQFLQDGRRVVVHNRRHQLRVQGLDNGEVVELTLGDRSATVAISLKVSADANVVASMSNHNEVWVWAEVDGAWVRSVRKADNLTSYALSADGTMLAFLTQPRVRRDGPYDTSPSTEGRVHIFPTPAHGHPTLWAWQPWSVTGLKGSVTSVAIAPR